MKRKKKRDYDASHIEQCLSTHTHTQSAIDTVVTRWIINADASMSGNSGAVKSGSTGNGVSGACKLFACYLFALVDFQLLHGHSME